ncbi:hypothetical protein FB639_002749 [Coemansia asiatica]|nr:hypothetical protein FB639_002749 [Coemansia asiatica]
MEDANGGPGPVRLGGIRRKSRQARNMANPTVRVGGTPTKPLVPSVRELTFKSLAPAASTSATATISNSQVTKKPSWAINK